MCLSGPRFPHLQDESNYTYASQGYGEINDNATLQGLRLLLPCLTMTVSHFLSWDLLNSAICLPKRPLP